MQICDFKIFNFGSGLPGKKSTCTNEGQHEKNEKPGQKIEDLMLTEKKHGFLSILAFNKSNEHGQIELGAFETSERS